MSLLVVPSARWSIRLSVAHWGVDAAAMAPGVNGRVLFHVGKQERCDDGAAGVFRDIGTSSWRDMAASPARHNVESFPSPPSGASNTPLRLFSDYWQPLTCAISSSELGGSAFGKPVLGAGTLQGRNSSVGISSSSVGWPGSYSGPLNANGPEGNIPNGRSEVASYGRR